jgi:hypothetical protein
MKMKEKNKDEKYFTDEEGNLYIIGIYDQHFPVNSEIRKMYPDSEFLPEEYDDCITGVEILTKSIIYDIWKVGERYIESVEGNSPKVEGTIYYSNQLMEIYRNPDPIEKIPLTLVLCDYYREYWKYILDVNLFHSEMLE